MRKLFLIFSFFILFFPTYAQFEKKDSSYRTINVKFNPFAMFQGPIVYTAEYRLGFEKPISTYSTFQILVSYLDKAPYVYFIESLMDNNDLLIINGYRAQVEFRNYFLDKKHGIFPFEGFYFAANGSYSHVNITTAYYRFRNEYIWATYRYLSLKLGYQYVYKHYTFDLFYGIGIRDIIWDTNIQQNSSNKLNKDDFVPFKGSIKILLGLNFGYRL